MAREIAAFYQSQGGLLTYDDLALFRVQIEAPVRVSFHEYDIYTCGPWCQGPVLAQVLSLLAGYDLPALGHNSSAYVTSRQRRSQTFADRGHGRSGICRRPDANSVVPRAPSAGN
jgi:gamma-glutamyltranspeptidase/glutathione hydrolase